MCVLLYIHNKDAQYTHLYYVNTNFYFGCDLIAINCLIILYYLKKTKQFGTFNNMQILLWLSPNIHLIDISCVKLMSIFVSVFLSI